VGRRNGYKREFTINLQISLKIKISSHFHNLGGWRNGAERGGFWCVGIKKQPTGCDFKINGGGEGGFCSQRCNTLLFSNLQRILTFLQGMVFVGLVKIGIS